MIWDMIDALDLYHTDPSQHLRTTGQGLDRHLSSVRGVPYYVIATIAFTERDIDGARERVYVRKRYYTDDNYNSKISPNKFQVSIG